MLTIPNLKHDAILAACEWDACTDGLAFLFDDQSPDIAAALSNSITNPQMPSYLVWFLCKQAGQSGWPSAWEIAELCLHVAEKVVEAKTDTDLQRKCDGIFEFLHRYQALWRGGARMSTAEQKKELDIYSQLNQVHAFIYRYPERDGSWVAYLMDRLLYSIHHLNEIATGEGNVLAMPSIMIGAATVAWNSPTEIAHISASKTMAATPDTYLPAAEAILAIIQTQLEVAE